MFRRSMLPPFSVSKSKTGNQQEINRKQSCVYFAHFFNFLGWVETESTWVPQSQFGLFYRPPMIDDNECGAVGVITIGNTRRKHDPMPLCPPQIPPELN
jgi:hypothetical protein